MPVVEAEHRLPIRPNHVYIIPPNKYVAIKGRHLVPHRPPESRAGQAAIDFALRSLAEDQREDAIGIVLSGTGSHGTAGLKEIKAGGGLVLVQDPTTAEHDQMPRSALESGMVVDYVLAPAKMPDALVAYSQRISRKSPGETAAPVASTLAGLEVIFETQSRRFAAVLRDSSEAIALLDLDGRIIAWNRGAETMYGYPEADAVKMSLHDLVTEEGRECTRDIMMRVAQGEVLPAFGAQRKTRDGRVIDVWATVTLLRDVSDRPASFATTERDVTAERRSARQMSAILDATPDGVVTIDHTGTIVTFNQSAVRLFGHRADEVIGRNIGLLMPPRESLRHGEYLDRYLHTRERHVIGTSREVNACRKDGTLFPVVLSVIEIEHLRLFAGFVHDMTSAKTLREEILKIAMLEQQRIGQELHDGTQQELTGLGLLAHDLSEALSRHGSHTEAKLAARLASGIAEANLHVRSLAHGLVPVPVDAETLPAALGELARSTRASYGLSCQFDCPQPVQVGIPSTATHLYRIAQEALGNAVKHAKADAISIRLTCTDVDLMLEITDNGIGIATGMPPHEGAGLRLMEYRCAVLGGRFTVQQQEGGGTLVACAIPLSGRS